MSSISCYKYKSIHSEVKKKKGKEKNDALLAPQLGALHVFKGCTPDLGFMRADLCLTQPHMPIAWISGSLPWMDQSSGAPPAQVMYPEVLLGKDDSK